MLHPLEQVRDHQNPLAHPPALASRQAPQLCRPQFAAKEVCRHRPSPQTWYAYLITLPHLGITGSRYKNSLSSDGVRLTSNRKSTALAAIRPQVTIGGYRKGM